MQPLTLICSGINSWWIGLTDLGHEGVWQWSHSMEEVTTTFWAKGSPSNSTHNSIDVAYIYHSQGDLSWRDSEGQGHGGSFAPVCQKGELGTPTTQEVQTTTTIVTSTTTDSATTTFGGCPSNWSEFNKSCFYARAEALTFLEASEKCRSYGAELASIHNKEEDEFVRSLAPATGHYYFWIGASDSNSEGEWSWLDGSSWDYQGWASGQPDGGTEQNCAELYTDGYWIDYSCNDHCSIVCRIN